MNKTNLILDNISLHNLLLLNFANNLKYLKEILLVMVKNKKRN